MINRAAARQCIDLPVLKRSLAVSIVVGTILCAINQGDAILARQPLIIWKTVLTYIVPFCVATYGAYSACVVHSRMQANPARPKNAISQNAHSENAASGNDTSDSAPSDNN